MIYLLICCFFLFHVIWALDVRPIMWTPLGSKEEQGKAQDPSFGGFHIEKEKRHIWFGAHSYEQMYKVDLKGLCDDGVCVNHQFSLEAMVLERKPKRTDKTGPSHIPILASQVKIQVVGINSDATSPPDDSIDYETLTSGQKKDYLKPKYGLAQMPPWQLQAKEYWIRFSVANNLVAVQGSNNASVTVDLRLTRAKLLDAQEYVHFAFADDSQEIDWLLDQYFYTAVDQQTVQLPSWELNYPMSTEAEYAYLCKIKELPGEDTANCLEHFVKALMPNYHNTKVPFCVAERLVHIQDMGLDCALLTRYEVEESQQYRRSIFRTFELCPTHQAPVPHENEYLCQDECRRSSLTVDLVERWQTYDQWDQWTQGSQFASFKEEFFAVCSDLGLDPFGEPPNLCIRALGRAFERAMGTGPGGAGHHIFDDHQLGSMKLCKHMAGAPVPATVQELDPKGDRQFPFQAECQTGALEEHFFQLPSADDVRLAARWDLADQFLCGMDQKNLPDDFVELTRLRTRCYQLVGEMALRHATGQKDIEYPANEACNLLPSEYPTEKRRRMKTPVQVCRDQVQDIIQRRNRDLDPGHEATLCAAHDHQATVKVVVKPVRGGGGGGDDDGLPAAVEVMGPPLDLWELLWNRQPNQRIVLEPSNQFAVSDEDEQQIADAGPDSLLYYTVLNFRGANVSLGIRMKPVVDQAQGETPAPTDQFQDQNQDQIPDQYQPPTAPITLAPTRPPTPHPLGNLVTLSPSLPPIGPAPPTRPPAPTVTLPLVEQELFVGDDGNKQNPAPYVALFFMGTVCLCAVIGGVVYCKRMGHRKLIKTVA